MAAHFSSFSSLFGITAWQKQARQCAWCDAAFPIKDEKPIGETWHMYVRGAGVADTRAHNIRFENNVRQQQKREEDDVSIKRRVTVFDEKRLWQCSGSILQPGEFLACSRRDRESGGFSQIWHVKQLLIAVAAILLQEAYNGRPLTTAAPAAAARPHQTTKDICHIVPAGQRECLVYTNTLKVSLNEQQWFIGSQENVKFVWRKPQANFFSVGNVFLCAPWCEMRGGKEKEEGG